MAGEIKRFTAYKVSIGLIGKGHARLEKDKDDPTKERFRYLTLKDKEINRINLIANIIDRFQSDQKNYVTLTLDDGTGQIRIKAFSDHIKLIENIQLGETILVIGTLRYFANELYILPEIVKPLDTRWLLVRKLELEKEYGELYTNLEQKPEQKIQQQPQTQPTQSEQKIQQQPQSQQSTSPESKPELKPINKKPVIEKPKIEEEKIGDANKKKTLIEQMVENIKQAESEEGIDIDKIIMHFNTYAVEEINNLITSLLEEGTIYEPKPGRLRIL